MTKLMIMMLSVFILSSQYGFAEPQSSEGIVEEATSEEEVEEPFAKEGTLQSHLQKRGKTVLAVVSSILGASLILKVINKDIIKFPSAERASKYAALLSVPLAVAASGELISPDKTILPSGMSLLAGLSYGLSHVVLGSVGSLEAVGYSMLASTGGWFLGKGLSYLIRHHFEVTKVPNKVRRSRQEIRSSMVEPNL